MTPNRPSVLVAILLVATTAGLLVGSGPASAHSGIQSYVYMSLYDGEIEGRVEYPIGDLAAALDIELPDERTAAFEVVEGRAADVVAYTDRHLRLGEPDDPWPLRFDGRVTRLDIGRTDYVQVPFTVDRRFVDTPRAWTVTYDGIIEHNPERDSLFLIEDDWFTATFRNESGHLLGFSVGNETQVVELDDGSTVSTMWEIGRRGSIAVDRSAAQLLALLAVSAPAVLAASNSGRDAQTIVTRLRRTAGRVGALVVGQSVTLWIVGLSGADISERVALACAATGGLVAAATVRLHGRTALATCAAAGLLTGAGLGWTFVELQLDRVRPITSLVAFDLGAALTVAFVTLLYTPMVLLLTRHRFAHRVAHAVAALAGVVALVWIVERLLGLTFRLRTLELTLSDLLTSPYVIAGATAVVAWFTFRASRPSTTGDGAVVSEPERVASR